MIKRLAPAALVFLTACATTAPSQYYRPAGAPDPVKISGDYNEFTYKVNISFNGDPVLSGNLPIFGSDVELSGVYSGSPVSAYCNRKTSALRQNIQCMVLMDNERAATLTF